MKYFVLIWLGLWARQVGAQDSLPLPDSNAKPAIRPPDVFHLTPAQDSSALPDSLAFPRSGEMRAIAHMPLRGDSSRWTQHPYFRFTNPLRYAITLRRWEGKEAIFYSMLALLICFALIRNGFQRYIQDLFKIFFRTTIKQRQVKDQLVQSPLPSLLLNIFFLLSIGMFLALVLQYYKMGLQFNFWMLYLYCALGLVVIYGMKYLALKFFGWVFQVADSIDAYIFIVFTTNKIIGIVLLPFLVLLAFTYGSITQAAFGLSIAVVVGLFAYRFFLSYVSIHRQVRISFFHFLLYLIAFEIAPLLLINKLLFRFLVETP